MTVTTADARLARLLEPYAPRPDLRFAAMRTLTSAGVRVVVLACPVMPLLNDSRPSLEAVAADARAAGAQYMYGNVLFLKPCAQKAFFPFLDEHYPRARPQVSRALQERRRVPERQLSGDDPPPH